MRQKPVIAAILGVVAAGFISIGSPRLADRIVGTWHQAKVEGPAAAQYTNAVRFAEMTFRRDGTYETRAGKTPATAFCASGTYSCVSSHLDMLSTAGDHHGVLARIENGMLVLTDGTNTGWMARSTD